MNNILENIRKNYTEIIAKQINGLDPIYQMVALALLSITVLLIFFLVAKFISKRKHFFYRFTKTELLADLIAQSLSTLIKLTGICLTLYLIGAESLIKFVIGTAGVIGLGLSFAFKDIIENYIAGIILSLRQPFRKGDHILIDSQEGIVMRMTTRMTMIKSFDGNNISIPNALIFKSVITNFTVIPERRFSFQIGIDANASPNIARQIGLKALSLAPEVMTDPSPSSNIHSIGDSSIVLEFFGWVNQDYYDFNQVRSLAISLVKESIETEGIQIPDPSFIIKLENNKVLNEDLNIQKQQTIGQSEKIESELLSPTKKETQVIKDQAEKEQINQPDLLD